MDTQKEIRNLAGGVKVLPHADTGINKIITSSMNLQSRKSR